MARRKRVAPGELPAPKVKRNGFEWVVRAGTYPKNHERAGDSIQFRLTLRTQREPLALESMRRLEVMRDRLVKLGRGADAEQLMKDAALHVEEPELFEAALMVGDIVEAQATDSPAPRGDWGTWASLGRAWLSGEVARRYPHKQKVKAPKTTTKELGIIDYLEPFIGAVPLESFNVSHYNIAMGSLPAGVKTDTARRHYHQTIMRIMRLAKKCGLITVWQLDEIEPIIIDKKNRPEFTCLRPEHIAKLIPSPRVEYRWRLLWGFMIWESPRIGYMAELRWRHIQTGGNGTVKMESKNGEVLHWDLRPGTLEALLEYKRQNPTSKGPFDWLKTAWKQLAAKILRRHLMRVGADDDELHKTEGRFRQLRAHDLRATFVVIAKLEGRSESWIMDRTGHHSSEMIQRYDRLSRVSIGSGGWTALSPLSEMLGSGPPAPSGGPAPLGAELDDEEDGDGADDDTDGDDGGFDDGVGPATKPGAKPTAAAGAETGGELGAQGRRGAPESAAERGAVTPTVTDFILCLNRGAEGGQQAMETTNVTEASSRFRRTDSNRNSGIQRPAIADETPQNTGENGGCDTQEGTGNDHLSRLAVTAKAAYAADLKRAMHAAIEAEAFTDIPELTIVFERASAAAGGAHVVDLALRRTRVPR